jgi:predicted CXXCH cytochrome family protein
MGVFGMKQFIMALMFLLVLVNRGYANIPHTTDACITCHKLMDEDQEEDAKMFPQVLEDVHLQVGLSCADCHGGNIEAEDDEDAAMWDDPTFVGKIERLKQPEMCGSCHADPDFMRQYSSSVKTDQLSKYRTSRHGELLAKGQEKVAVCTDCHNVHAIFPVNDPRATVYPTNVPSTCSQCHSDVDYMAEFNIPTDQYFKYRSSVHGKALIDRQSLGAPACNDCHGSHGALPPNVINISDVCGTCHVNNYRLFQKSHLNNIFVKRGFGQCEVCHGNHGIKAPTDEYLNWEHGAVCVQCHKNTGNPKDLADLFYNTIDSLKNQIAAAKELMAQAEQKGMEVSDLYFPIEDAHKVLIQTRTSIHSFNKDFMLETAAKGFESTQAAIEGSLTALKEYDTRRKWLFLLSLTITYLAIIVYFKIKDYDRRSRNKKK